MSSLRRFFPLAAAFFLAAFGSASTLRAGAIIVFAEIGSDVVASGSGTLNLGGLLYQGTNNFGGAFVDPSWPEIAVGPPLVLQYAWYSGTINGPPLMGPGGTTDADSGSGTLVDLDYTRGSLNVSNSYSSGDAFTTSSTWNNATFASLGLTPGAYTYTWGSGSNADFLTFQIGTAAAVPEPSSLLLAATLAGGIGTLRLAQRALRRRKAA
ncbi:MAG: hypothetical protein U0794_11450, partial [Isosphaeraceae bacterium]